MNLDEAIEGLEKLVAEVRSASLTDDKTRLGSPLALRQEARSVNEGTSEFEVIIFGDLNDFKHLNNLHGHDAGDVAINEVGEVITKLVEEMQGKAFRQSGDEFVILLKQSQLANFLSVSASFRKIPFHYNRQPLETAMSLGYVLGKQALRISLDGLKSLANSRKQKAKAFARNGQATLVITRSLELAGDVAIAVRGLAVMCLSRMLRQPSLRARAAASHSSD